MITSPVQEIKDKLDIAEFIRSYIPIFPAGKNFKANCPFHKEKTPSFIVSPERQTWHCFGACGEGGDIFKFLMKYENLEFYEALKVLAEKAGIELKKTSPSDYKQFGILYDINESAKDFFKKELENNKDARDYLIERGLKKETIDEFEIGFTPNAFDNSIIHLINSGYNIKDIERAGLASKSERGNYIDRFRGRVVFPIHNSAGKIVGFSGRILPKFDNGEFGKYINSPETPIFNKSKILYGFHKTKQNIKEEGFAVLVEGQMDFAMLYQDGVKNIFATSGTALTEDHLRTLKRLTDQITLCFDSDEAGFNAAERAIDLAGANDFLVKILAIVDYKDPAEAVLKKPGVMAELLKNSVPAVEFYFKRYLKVIQNAEERIQNFDMPEFKKNIRIILGKIKNLASAVEKAHWIKELSNIVKIDEKSLLEEMDGLKATRSKQSLQNSAMIMSPNAPALSRRELIAQRLISLLIVREDFRSKVDGHLEYLPEEYLLILRSITERIHLDSERLIGMLNFISLRSSIEAAAFDSEKIEEEFKEVLGQLRAEYLKEKRKQISYSIKEAELKSDNEKMEPALKEFDEISKLIQG